MLVLPNFPSPDVARALSPNGRKHWSAKKTAREWVAARVALALHLHPVPPVTGRARLAIRWVFPQERKRDLDNHTTGVVKALIDALVQAQVLSADDSAHLELAPVEIVVERGQRRMELTLEALEAACPTSGT